MSSNIINFISLAGVIVIGTLVIYLIAFIFGFLTRRENKKSQGLED